MQRKIDPSDLEWSGFRKAPPEAVKTAIGLWVKATDREGRCEADPELLAGLIHMDTSLAATVEEHLLMLHYCGFLDLYHVDGVDLIALQRPLQADARSASFKLPPPPLREPPRSFAAVGGAQAGAGGSARERDAARASAWAEWEAEQERGLREPPRRPLLDAPPIGCPDHPNGRFAACGPCGTARRRHDLWLAKTLDGEEVARHEPPDLFDDEPF